MLTVTLLARTLVSLCFLVSHTSAAPSQPGPRSTDSLFPVVKLDNGTFVGTISDITDSVHAYLGIPFAQPPVGNLRYRLPVPIGSYNSTIYTATSFGPACFQQDVTLPLLTGLPADVINAIVNSIYGAVFADAEDCLTINIWKPASATSTSKLPVLAWIFGGGFELGSTETYDGASIVSRSIAMGQPIVFVSMNYRLSGIGFLASKEVKAAGVGNLGLQDQRESLRWIQKYITAFGGDPTKVTIQGESAGAISVALHMVTNGGNTQGLFRGGFMQSGSPIPVGDISHGQVYYDQIVANVGCSSASDTLACLRTVSYAKLTAAINKTPSIFAYQSLDLAWLPRVDGVFLTAPPYNLVQSGSVAKIPFVTGDCDDEGTLFSLANANVTTDAQFTTYMKEFYLPSGTTAQIAQAEVLYPQDPAAGSPFDTGALNALTPEFKRLAAVQGDLVFQGPRRWFLRNVASKQKAWSFAYKRNKDFPILGTFHGSDILNMFGGGELADYAIAFTTSQDPNGASLGPSWPTWTSSSPVSMGLVDGSPALEILNDTYRAGPIDYLNSLALIEPI